jgi:hypothetical protein
VCEYVEFILAARKPPSVHLALAFRSSSALSSAQTKPSEIVGEYGFAFNHLRVASLPQQLAPLSSYITSFEHMILSLSNPELRVATELAEGCRM